MGLLERIARTVRPNHVRDGEVTAKTNRAAPIAVPPDELAGELCDQRNVESESPTTTTNGSAHLAPAVMSRVVVRKRIALIPARGGARTISATDGTRKCEFHVRLATSSSSPFGRWRARPDVLQLAGTSTGEFE